MCTYMCMCMYRRLLKEVVGSRDTVEITTLYLAVRGIQVIINKDPSIVLEEGLDISLFELLDWCISRTPADTSTAYTSLELSPSICGDLSPMSVCDTQRDVGAPIGSGTGVDLDPVHLAGTGNGGGSDDVSVPSLQLAVEEALLTLSRALVTWDADRYTSSWILFCRAVALSMKPSAELSTPGSDAPGQGANSAEEEGEGIQINMNAYIYL
jgi:hypothetical protein